MTEPRAINCKQLVELVTDYLEGAMAPATRGRFEAHLRRCRHCRASLAQMRTTIALLGELPEERIEPPAREALLAAFRDWNAGRR